MLTVFPKYGETMKLNSSGDELFNEARQSRFNLIHT